MNRALLFCYRFLLMPTVVTLLPIAALFNKKLRLGIRLRRGAIDGFPPQQNPVWIHAASGEFEYAKALIRELKEQDPKLPILVTYFSPTFAKVVNSFPGVDRALPLPLDLPGPCTQFLAKMHPRLLLIARTDLWPEMLENCRQRKIPVVIFSYTQKRFTSRLKKYFTRIMLQWVSRIYCVSKEDLENLHDLELKVLTEDLGDSRYDQVHYRLTHPKSIAKSLYPNLPCLVAGSTWPEDEAILIPALTPLLKERLLQLILVPHEPTHDHIQALTRQLDSQSLTYTLYSSGTWTTSAVLIVDKVGVLAELYALGTLAFVGGSFKKSVHSVMEALGTGATTLVGPYHENNREAVEFKNLLIESLPGLRVVTNEMQLRECVQSTLAQPTQTARFAHALKAEFARRLGATQRLVHVIRDLLY